MKPELVAIAVPVPLFRTFDYFVPERLQSRLRPGMRVRVPFGRRQLIGVVAQPPQEQVGSEHDYRAVESAIDEAPVLPPDLLFLCRWAADYYQYPVGEVFALALPGPLRRGQAVQVAPLERLRLTAAGREAQETLPARHRALLALLTALRNGPLPASELEASAAVRRRALERGWIEATAVAPEFTPLETPPSPTQAQQQALDALAAADGFGVTLLEGVTGSGKTEVYLRLIANCLARGQQALVLVPEIGLTPQLLERFRQRFGPGVAGFHSGMTEHARTQTWLRARSSELGVVIGTRSAVFVPFARLGMVVIDEEHDPSYKQQDTLRYSARDLAIVRAQRLKIPVLLGTATPSLESLHNAVSGRYRHLTLASRAQGVAPPRVRPVDIRGLPLHHGLSVPLLDAAARHLDAGGQVLFFINRRGYAPVLLCHQCGWTAPCPHCDARLTLHRGRSRLICHHCGVQQGVPDRCPSCALKPLLAVGEGTERIEDALKNRFPQHRVERFDSDRLSRAGALEQLLADVSNGAVDVLVGTQILAKGHDFAGVSMVGIVSADQALYGTDFRAVERMGQLVTQVAGRAGRAGQPGEVLLQTHEPEHPLLKRLVDGGYRALCEALLESRRDAGLPPFEHLALLRAESNRPSAAQAFLGQARRLFGNAGPSLRVSDPVPAPMEKRAGMHRAQLLVQSRSRNLLQRELAAAVAQLSASREARAVRWSVDVDPADLF